MISVLTDRLKLRTEIFNRQYVGDGYSTESVGKIVFMKQLDAAKMAVQALHCSVGQDSNAIFEPLSITNDDLVLIEIDILNAQSNTLHTCTCAARLCGASVRRRPLP